ncbi:MAG: putative baseplate assembly protein [Cyanobacteria bacterium P01_D01_bin.116]
MLYFCCNERRRQAIRQTNINGIDYLEVLDTEFPEVNLRQRTLLIYCFQPLPIDINKEQVKLEGGVRITPVQILWAFPVELIPSELVTEAEQTFFSGLATPEKVLVVRTDSTGDFSTYQFSFDINQLEQFDPQLSAIDFSFKVECPSDFDCEQERVCPPEANPESEIDYLAKDYASFRQLMLDRITLLVPQWQERNVADIGVALVELLAYVGDRLSYQQDTYNNNAYLGTAKSRIAVRRHARLLDYFINDGSNARVWVHLRVDSSIPPDEMVPLERSWEQGENKYRTQFFSRCTEQGVTIEQHQITRLLMDCQPEVFEPLHDSKLYGSHNEIFFYTWGDQECCLPKGATRATLLDHYPNLQPGDVLIFTEVFNPNTGKREDANLSHRHAIRLTKVTPKTDPLGWQFVDTENEDPLPVTDIEWAQADALPFPLCLSTKIKTNVSIALGNIVLADHGRTITDKERLGEVPTPKLFAIPTQSTSKNRCQTVAPQIIPPRYNPVLQETPLTQGATVIKTILNNGQKQQQQLPFDPQASASEAFPTTNVLPAITLTDRNQETWLPQRDLLNSDKFATEFVAEVETDGRVMLRFGNNINGSRPPSGTLFTATYRVGNGNQGNIGAESLAHIFTNQGSIVSITNPLAARGGTEPETIEQVRQYAPSAFRTQERAVTVEDYAEIAQRHPQVQKAVATFRWTGSWYTVFVTIDRFGFVTLDEEFKEDIRQYLEGYNLAGFDLKIDAPRFVPLEIAMSVCVKPNYFRSDVKATLLEVFNNRILPNGQRGVFHPDNFTFGQPVYLSPLYSAAQAVAGVESVEITTFERQRNPNSSALNTGRLNMERLEIARLDNDPNFPEQGVFLLTMLGGNEG